MNRLLKFLIPIIIASIFFILPAPVGLKVVAWHLLGIFIATIVALVLQTMAEASILLTSLAASAFFVLPLKEILVGYTDETLWLIVFAIMFSVGFKKSGLARRIGLLLINKFGTTPLRIGYIMSFMDLLLATSTPAAPARSGGIVYPLIEGVIDACDSKPGPTARRIGSYLTVLCYMTSMITGSIFMTGMGPNLINVKLAQQMLGITITWPMWTIAALPGIIAFLMVPYLVYKIYPPEITSLEGVKQSAGQDLNTMGGITRKEIITSVIFVLTLGLWATTSITNLNATAIALLGIVLMLLLNILQWKDLSESKEILGMVIWFGAILGLSSALTSTGFFIWLAELLKTVLPTTGFNVYVTFILIALLATIPHYLFASYLSYCASFSPLIFSFVVATGAPKLPSFFLVAFLMVISGTLTHYGNGLGPMLFAKGFNDKKNWWGLGFVVTLLCTVLYLTIGLAWWKFIGYWY